MLKILGAATVGALALAGLTAAAPQRDAYRLTANLAARFEVPTPRGVPTGARGLFAGQGVELENDRVRLSWRLTFARLSGRALAAHVHTGRARTAGGVMVALCGPCRSGQRGTTTVSHAQLRVIRAGRAYVNVHTARNQAGEIRGQLRATTTTAGDDPAPPGETTPEPPPYSPYP